MVNEEPIKVGSAEEIEDLEKHFKPLPEEKQLRKEINGKIKEG